MYNKRKEIMFIGDLNLNLQTGNANPAGPNKEVSEFCNRFCLTNCIQDPTRMTDSTQTLLDVILVSHPERHATSGNLHFGLSDHDLIYIVRKQNLPKPKARSIEFRSMKNLDKSAFLSDLNAVWDSAFSFGQVDDVRSHWASLYKQILYNHLPIRKIHLRFNQLPWINPNIQREIRRRIRLYKKFRRFQSD